MLSREHKLDATPAQSGQDYEIWPCCSYLLLGFKLCRHTNGNVSDLAFYLHMNHEWNLDFYHVEEHEGALRESCHRGSTWGWVKKWASFHLHGSLRVKVTEGLQCLNTNDLRSHRRLVPHLCISRFIISTLLDAPEHECYIVSSMINTWFGWALHLPEMLRASPANTSGSVPCLYNKERVIAQRSQTAYWNIIWYNITSDGFYKRKSVIYEHAHLQVLILVDRPRSFW